jgi:hypothetical protein
MSGKKLIVSNTDEDGVERGDENLKNCCHSLLVVVVTLT